MMKIHQTGSALCGVYPKDTALTIQNKIHSYAFKFGYPLKCKIEE
jgi:ATP-dependent Clp protease adaptor protein ClpS